jgi:hypothetical protein
MQGEFDIGCGTAAGDRCDDQQHAGLAVRVVGAKAWAQAVAIRSNNGARNCNAIVVTAGESGSYAKIENGWWTDKVRLLSGHPHTCVDRMSTTGVRPAHRSQLSISEGLTIGFRADHWQFRQHCGCRNSLRISLI